MSFLTDRKSDKKTEKKEPKEPEIIHTGSSCPHCHNRAKSLKVKSGKVECVACGCKYNL